jgi:hypothetical protein
MIGIACRPCRPAACNGDLPYCDQRKQRSRNLVYLHEAMRKTRIEPSKRLDGFDSIGIQRKSNGPPDPPTPAARRETRERNQASEA